LVERLLLRPVTVKRFQGAMEGGADGGWTMVMSPPGGVHAAKETLSSF